MRVVLDTSVVVSGLRSRLGASYRILQMVSAGKLRAPATPPLFLEYEEVLKRPEHRLVHGLDLLEIDEFLNGFSVGIEPVVVHFLWRPQLPDAKDEMVLDAAINGAADALITHNVADFASAGERFGIEVLKPQELLKRVKS